MRSARRRSIRRSTCKCGLDQPVLRRPPGQLVARRELQLAEHVRDVALDRLHGQVQPRGDLLVHVPARDQLQHLPLARRQLVEVGVAAHPVAGAEGVQHEPREAWREYGVAARDLLDRRRQLRAGDGLRDVAAGAGADHRNHVLGGIRDGQREELHARPLGRHLVDDRVAAPVRQVHVEQHHVGVELLDQRHGGGDASRLPDHLDRVTELGPHAREEEIVVVDQDNPALHASALTTWSSTSVPSPGLETTVALPPARSSRFSIDSDSPRLSAGTAERSNPNPRSRTNTDTSSSVTSAYTSISSAPENLAAFVIASRAASTTAPTAPSTGQSPALASSTRTPWSSSTSPAAAERAATSDAFSSPSGRSAYSQPRSSRSWRRASDTTRCGSCAWRWISASVWRTESC